MLTGAAGQARPVAMNWAGRAPKADLLPEDKASALEALGPTRQTLMVGDGINDAPVLATRWRGGHGNLGSEAAIETTQTWSFWMIIPCACRNCFASPGTGALSGENIVLALGTGGFVHGLGIVGLFGLWEAVFRGCGRGSVGRARQRFPRRADLARPRP